MKIAIVTGASSGMGKEFVYQLSQRYKCLDEIWVIARNKKKLKELQKNCPKKVVPVPADLRKRAGQEILKEKLYREKPRVKILVNGAGVGKIGCFQELSEASQRSMVRLNCEALTAVSHLVLPYLHRGSRIIMLASAAAFVPQPGFAVYAASKAYVLSFARALRSELHDRGITVTAVCPGPVDTPFFEKAEQLHAMPSFKKSSMAAPEAVVEQAIRDAAGLRELSVYGRQIKVLALICKLFPHGLVILVTRWLEKLEKD